MRVGVLLTPSFLEAEAALALEVCRLLGLEAFTFAKARSSLEGQAGAVWTPRFALSGRPQMEVLVVPGGASMRRMGRDPVLQGWLEEAWPHLQAVFLGANASLFLAEAGYLGGTVTAQALAREALAERGFRVVEAPLVWHGKVCSTRGYLDLARALLDWQLAPPGLRQHLGLHER
ncbi:MULTISPECIES: DJ-1/PfpI family protein [unclassified Meiothermus]|uniref:DJ-1/PfpI family protein n=1 Tax=unclassified Meiothermus TaxID=370471 RepID=UPI000D7D1030|nr:MULTISPECIES: DJ-1/PfpI family protein [unclassified Meiothermus]PZA06166.1 thiamine biosynthesis protein ThiJ [Meiothermus sp. Pnk-1]RYM36192.1 thiamine biosynthesis protein ThiJ [Meiothermus sp. PNK-Is4]